jgi:ABC-2 type transport system permease protein
MFGVDRQALVMSIAIPVIIASILGWLDTTAASDKASSKTLIAVVDEDRSAVSKDFYARLKKSDDVTPTQESSQDAIRGVRTGEIPFAVVIPKGFSDRAAAAFGGGTKPDLPVYQDPAKPLEANIALGEVTKAVSEAAATATFGSIASGGVPMNVEKMPLGAAKANWESAAHDYAGFGLQGLLFFAIESAVALARERRLGIWKRLRAAPIHPNLLLLSKAASSTVLALAIILLIFLVGAVLFHVRILGSVLGFAFVAVASALMAAAFGLLMATIGKSESQGRAISFLLIILMLATGGAWFPMTRMPRFVQTAANYLPVRWAVEGFDAATWRGLQFSQIAHFGTNLLVFALVFGILATLRFRFLREQA